MRRLLWFSVLLVACGGEAAVVTDVSAGSLEGRWGTGFPTDAGTWLAGSGALQWLSFTGGAYERGGTCAEHGTWRMAPSADENGAPARDVVLVPARGESCEGHALLWHSSRELWLRPQPFIPFRR